MSPEVKLRLEFKKECHVAYVQLIKRGGLLKKNMILIFLGLVLTSLNLNAAVIKQLLNSENLAVIELTETEKSEQFTSFIAQADDKQCLLKVLSTKDALITASTEKCNDKSVLKVGMTLEKSLFDTSAIKDTDSKPKDPVAPNAQPNTEENSSRLYNAILVGININPSMKIDGKATSGGASENGTFEYKFNPSVHFGYELSQFNRNSWNNGFSLEFSKMNFDEATVSGSNSTTSTFSLTGSMSVFSVLYQGKYLWNSFYIPVATGFVSNSVDSTGSYTKTIKTRWMLGFGVGVALNNDLLLEFKSMAATVTSDSFTSSGVTYTPDVGYFSTAQITMKYLIF